MLKLFGVNPLNKGDFIAHGLKLAQGFVIVEQAHIDGNKGLIYAQIEGGFRTSSRTIPLEPPVTRARWPFSSRLSLMG